VFTTFCLFLALRLLPTFFCPYGTRYRPLRSALYYYRLPWFLLRFAHIPIPHAVAARDVVAVEHATWSG